MLRFMREELEDPDRTAFYLMMLAFERHNKGRRLKAGDSLNTFRVTFGKPVELTEEEKLESIKAERPDWVRGHAVATPSDGDKSDQGEQTDDQEG